MAVSIAHVEQQALTPLSVATIERIDAPSSGELLTRYVQPRRPVVLQGISDAWPARQWTLDLLKREFGDVTVQVALTRAGSVIADPRRGLLHRRTLLRDYLASLESDDDAAYLMAPAEDLPEQMRHAVSTPPYCEGAAWVAAKFWLSRAGAVSAMHRDLADNLHTQIFGTKRFSLVDPGESAGVYPNGLLSSIPNGCQTNIEAPDFARFPRLAGVHLRVAELRPGDTIYIPRRWWHHVRTTAVSLSVNHWWARGAWATVVQSADLFKRLRGISR
jgi:lysine-specific demethylase 8